MNFGKLQDGIVTMDVYGRVVRIFRPPWWAVHRWIAFWLAPESVACRTTITWIVPIRGTKFWTNNGKVETAVYLVPRAQQPSTTHALPPEA